LLLPRNIVGYVAARPAPFLLSGAVIALFALPIVIHTIIAWPGEIPKYLRFAAGQRNAILDSIRYIVAFLPLWGVWCLIFLIPPPNRHARPDLETLRFVGLLALITPAPAALVYAWRGIDDLSQQYLLLWTLPFVAVAMAVCALYVAFIFSLLWLRAAIIAACVIYALHTDRVLLTPVGQPAETTSKVAKAVDVLAQRAVPGRKIVVKRDHDPAAGVQSWSQLLAILAAMNRRNENFLCIDAISWHLSFHERYRCRDADAFSEILYATSRDKAAGNAIAELAENVAIVPAQPPTVGRVFRSEHPDALGMFLWGNWTGAWSDGRGASVGFDARALPQKFAMQIRARIFPVTPPPPQTVKITDSEGRELGTMNNNTGATTATVRIELSKPTSDAIMTVHFAIPAAPAEPHSGAGLDPRRGFWLEQVSFEN